MSINTTWNLFNFRAGLIRALLLEGYEVVTASPNDKYSEQVAGLGCRLVHLPMDNKGTNPLRDLVLFFRYVKLFLKERPDVFLSYTIKPNIYGSLAARVCRIPVINNVAGLGTVFQKDGWLNQLVRQLYRLALACSYRVFFQNTEDRELFVSTGLVLKNISGQLPGSGVDLNKFPATPMPTGSSFRFLMICRMLWDKGVGEYVEAARLLNSRGENVEFCLLGFLDVENPNAVNKRQMDEWVREGFVNYLGVSDNVSEEIAKADCVVLPSYYREGTPRSLLEAAAMARPIITTDNVGCRDTIEDGVSGFLCRPRDACHLAEKMQMMIELTHTERELMGLNGRSKVEREFDENIVVDRYLEVIAEVKDGLIN